MNACKKLKKNLSAIGKWHKLIIFQNVDGLSYCCAERLQHERQEALENMGISVQASGIMVEKNKYYLVNLNADPSLNELLVYYLKDRTLVGAKVIQHLVVLGFALYIFVNFFFLNSLKLFHFVFSFSSIFPLVYTSL